jgi:serine/threonine-protein kinase
MAGSRRIGGRYRLAEPLGSGGMSIVWRAFDEVLQRPVAVKVLAGDVPGDATLAEAIRREAQAAARLCHPHIASVYDYGESTVDGGGPTPFVVMELVTGEPLSALLAGGARLPWREAAGICAQVASALSEAHAHGVVHRDVKPGNVMIGRSGAKVVDFGISALVGECDLDAGGQLLGTPAYVAPERLEGGRAETASDVYAVGVLLYRSLTGHLPWPVETPLEMMRAHRENLPPALHDLDDLEDLPDEVRRACRECLERDPERRPRSEDLARTLGEASGAAVPFPSPVAVRVAGSSGSTTAWLAIEDAPLSRTSSLLAVFDADDLWPARSSPGLRELLPAWLTRSPVTRRVAVALLTVLVLGVAAAYGGASATSPPPRTSTMGDPAGQGVAAVGSGPDCRVHYQVERDWRTGFAAVVTVTNDGPADIAGATLRFRFPGEQSVVRGGRWRQDGHEMSADLAVRTGRSVRLPFTARYREENPLPLSFLVDGVICDAVVTGPRGVQVAGDESSDSSDNSGPGSDNSGRGSGRGKKNNDKDDDDGDDRDDSNIA